MDAVPKPSRRGWFRFSLRALLILVLAIGSALAWTLHKAREQGIAVAALERLGCSVEYEYNEPLTTIERLRKWCGEKEYRNVFAVNASNSQLTDAALADLKGLTQLLVLELNGTQITDVGLAHLEQLAQRLTQLQWLSLNGTQVTDAGLAHLERLTLLSSLELNGTRVTDAGLAHLERLTRLQSLSLDGTQITDAGLAHLEGLTQLEWLFLGGTQVTDVGAEELQKALPNLRIDRYGQGKIPAAGS